MISTKGVLVARVSPIHGRKQCLRCASSSAQGTGGPLVVEVDSHYALRILPIARMPPRSEAACRLATLAAAACSRGHRPPGSGAGLRAVRRWELASSGARDEIEYGPIGLGVLFAAVATLLLLSWDVARDVGVCFTACGSCRQAKRVPRPMTCLASSVMPWWSRMGACRRQERPRLKGGSVPPAWSRLSCGRPGNLGVGVGAQGLESIPRHLSASHTTKRTECIH